MPYDGMSDPQLPEHVRGLSQEKRRQWVAVFNSVYEKTGDDGQAMTAANGAVKEESSVKHWGASVKALASGVFGGYGVVFDVPQHGGHDLDDEMFTAETDFWESIPTSITIYDHAMGLHPDMIDENGNMKATEVMPRRYEIGKVIKREQDKYGIWFEAVLDENLEWREYVEDLIAQGALNWSTDSIPHLVRREFQNDGTSVIKSWPIPAISLTPRAAEPRAAVSLLQRLDEVYTKSVPQARLIRVAQDAPPNECTQEKNIMEHLTEAELLKAARLVVNQKWDSLKGLDFVKGVQALKAEGDTPEEETPEEETKMEGDLAAQVLPIAQSSAALFGGTTEEWMTAIMQIGAAMQTSQFEAAAPAEEPMAEGGVLTEEVMSYDRKAVRKALNMGGYKTQNVTPLRRDPEKAPQFARFIKALVNPHHPENANFLWNHHNKAKQAWKAQGLDPDTAGGYLTTPEKNNEVIEFLRAEAIVAGMCRTYPMKSSRLEIPRLDTGVEVVPTAENAALTEDEAVFGNVTAEAVKLAVIVKFSREIIEDSDPDVEQVLKEDIGRAGAEKLDRQIVYGDGVGNNLLGLVNRPGITKTDVSGTLTYGELTQCQQRLEEANVAINDRVQWLIDPKVKRIIRELQDGASRLIFTGGGEGTQLAGTVPDYILDYRWRLSNLLVPAGTSARRLFLAQWQDVVLGQRKQMEFMSSDQAGTAFQNDQVWIRMVMRVALAVRHDESVQILTNITAAGSGV